MCMATKLIRWLAVLCAVAMLAAACSTDSNAAPDATAETDTSDTTVGDTESTEEATTPEPTTSTEPPAATGDPDSPETGEPVATEGELVAATVEPFTAPSDDLVLEGDLYLPAGPGPHPAVVLIHGSGPVDRTSAVAATLGITFPAAIPIFTDIATTLQAEGIAVAVYDKRSCATFNGCGDNSYLVSELGDVLVTDFQRDAEAVVATMRARDDISAVSVAGHSQGGQFVPWMLAADPELTAGILLAAPARPIDVSLTEQAAALRTLPGGDVAAQGLEASLGGVIDLRNGDESNLPLFASADFFRSWFAITDDLPTIVGDITQPILALNGDFDLNVGADHLADWDALLSDAGVDVDVQILPCVTHLLNCIDAPLLDAGLEDLGTAVTPAITDAMIDFLQAT